MVDVTVNGRPIVSATTAFDLDGTTGTLVFQSDGLPVGPTSGEAASLSATITDVVPRYRALLDDVANTLVTTVNAVHSVGYDQAGTTGRTFFTPAGVTAATISLSTDVVGQPSHVAAGAPVLPGPTAPGPLDGEQARLMAALADSATGADSKYHAMITGLAVETRGATQRAEIQDQVAESAIRDADSVGAVSIDEEMAGLVAAQRAFEASARVFTVIDEMLQTLIERTGVVGR
jgi:flagellar hook-associated protein 1 FlgK